MHDSAAGREIGQGHRRGRHCRNAPTARTAAARASRAAWRGAGRTWRWLGIRGRLVVLLPLADTIGKAAGDAGVLPDREMFTGGLSLAIIAFAIGGLVWLRVRGQRATERGQREFPLRARAGNAVIDGGGWGPVAQRQAEGFARLEQDEARLSAAEGRQDDQDALNLAMLERMDEMDGKLDAIWGEMARRSGIPVSRRLRLVRPSSRSSQQGA